jgi:hypothetical protein
MVRKLYVVGLVVLMMGALARAEADHGAATNPPTTPTAGATPATSHPEGDADKKFKDEAMDFFADVFAPQPKTLLTELYADKLPPAVASAKDGKFQDISNILTPLFGTLNNNQFDSLMKKVDDKIDAKNREAQDHEGVTDNKFLDLLDLIKKYGKVIQNNPDKSTDKDKAASDLFKKDFDAQQKKNKDLLAKVDELKKLKPEQKDERAKLQKEILAAVNQKGFLAWLKGQLETGNDKNKGAARDFRGAIATRSDSGHLFIDTIAGGQPERLHLGLATDSATADKAFDAYAKARGGLGGVTIAPAVHTNPKNFFVDAGGGLVEGTPSGFQFTPPQPPPPPAQPTQQQQGHTPPPPTGTTTPPAGDANATAAITRVTQVLAEPRCTGCHGTPSTNGATNLRDLRFRAPNKPGDHTAAEILANASKMSLTPAEKAAFQAIVDGGQ